MYVLFIYYALVTIVNQMNSMRDMLLTTSDLFSQDLLLFQQMGLFNFFTAIISFQVVGSLKIKMVCYNIGFKKIFSMKVTKIPESKSRDQILQKKKK